MLGGLLRDISIRVKLAVLVGAVVAVVVLGQTFQALATEAVQAQQEISLSARLMLVSLAGAIGPTWTDARVPELAPYAKKLSSSLEVRTLALVDADGTVVAYHGAEPTGAEVRSVIQLRLRTLPRNLFTATAGRVEFLVATPIMHGERARGYLLCGFSSDEPTTRLRELLWSALLSAFAWVAVGGGLTLWITGRLTRPLVRLADDLAHAGPEGYSLPPEGRAEAEIGVVQERLVAVSDRLAAERARVAELTRALRHQVDVVTADLVRTAGRQQAILDSTSDAILLVRGDDVVIAANGPARAFFGAEVTAEGVMLPALVRDEDAMYKSAAKARALAEPIMLHAESKREVRPGEPRYLRVRLAPVVGALEPGDMVVIAEDVTESGKMEEQMQRSERLASIGTLTAGLAHQIGNHLHSIRGYSDLLARRLRDADPEVQQDLESVKNEVRAASGMMDKVLLVARTRPPTMAPLDVCGVVREAAELVRLGAKRNQIEISVECETRCEAVGDPQLLMQALLNLMMNAVQAMAGGGKLSVSSGLGAGGQCLVHIRDTGPGMPAEVRARIFDPFFTTKPEGEGTGLGLPIAQRIVELHGGVIAVESALGAGTTFTIELPGRARAGERSGMPT